jgi:phospholipid/cholesterol/gamma-HCH transport system substrate-binding protein
VSPRIAITAAAAVACIAVLVIALGGSDPYVLRVPLENASGLKSGSPVTVGGVSKGKVELHLEKGDQVIAELRLDRDAGPVGRDARVSIAAANFLGQKRVRLEKGDVSQPAPSGYVLPESRVTTPTDLDQVLSVLDADTRTRAKILLNEAGAAVLGRRVDIATLIKEFPLGFRDGTRVLQRLRADDERLGDLVVRSDSLVDEVTDRRGDLVRMIDVVGRAAQNASAQRAELRSTLARAPRTLTTLQRFLGDLEATARPLGPAAREITASAPPLAATLAEVRPFGRAAIPTLREARAVAPSLVRLASEGTPVLRRARPTVKSLAEVSEALVGVSRTLDGSSDNILAILENWSRAIQFRDGLSHVFRGEASFTPEFLQTMVSRLAPKPATVRRKSRKEGDRTPTAQVPAPQRPGRDRPRLPKLPPAARELLDKIQPPPAVKKLLDQLEGGSSGQNPQGDSSLKGLFDFLMAD